MQTIIIDIGTQNFYTGVTSNNESTNVKIKSGPTLIGKTTKYPYCKIPPTTLNDFYYGNELENFTPGVLFNSRPVERSIWKDSFHLENFIDYLLDVELNGADPENHSFLLPEYYLHPFSNIELKAEIMFEVFNVPSLLIENTNWLTLLGYGRTSGIVASIGAGVTQVSPFIHESDVRFHSAISQFGGNDLTLLTKRLLSQYNLMDGSYKYQFESITDQFILDCMKHQLGTVSLMNNNNNNTTTTTTSYQLPDGFKIEMKQQDCELIGEALFNCEEITGQEITPIHLMIHEVIQNCAIDTRRDLYDNIMLSGGTTKMNGFDARLHRELSLLAPANVNVQINSDDADDDRSHISFNGACVLAQMSLFNQLAVTGKMYDEEGPIRAVDAFTSWHY
jgi:actin